MDSEGGSRRHSSGVGGGEASVCGPYYQLTISQLPAIYQANYLLPSTAEQQIQDYRTRPTNNSLVAPDKQGPADDGKRLGLSESALDVAFPQVP